MRFKLKNRYIRWHICCSKTEECLKATDLVHGPSNKLFSYFVGSLLISLIAVGIVGLISYFILFVLFVLYFILFLFIFIYQEIKKEKKVDIE